MNQLRLAPLIPRTVNPFRVPAIRYSPWYVFKTAAVAVTLFPVRCVVLLLFLGVSVLFGRLATLGVDRDHPRPSAVRRLLVQPIRLCARAALWSLGYWWVRVEYRAGSAPGRARVLAAAPHYSLLDAIVLAWLELPSSVAKAGVARMPLFGAVAVALQCIFVDRQDPESKHKCVDAIRERATNPAGAPLLLFPEGTCTNGEALITFKAGAFLPGAPVQPVVLRYPFSHLSVSAAGGDAEWRLLLCLFSVYNRLTVIYLPLYTPSAEEVADPALFARNVRAVMAAELGVGVTAHSYEDVWLAAKATAFGVEQNFEVQSITALLSISPDGVTKLLEKFHSLDLSGDGLLGEDEFAAALGLQDASPKYAARLFSFFDADGSGAISYVEFVQGLALLSPNTSAEEKVKAAFLLCDLDASGGVTLANLTRVLELCHAGANLAADPPAADPSTADPSTADPSAVAVTPFYQQSEPRRLSAFSKYDVNKDRVLDYEEFAAFVRDHTDILAASEGLMRGRLGSTTELLPSLTESVAKIKRERSEKAAVMQ